MFIELVVNRCCTVTTFRCIFDAFFPPANGASSARATFPLPPCHLGRVHYSFLPFSRALLHPLFSQTCVLPVQYIFVLFPANHEPSAFGLDAQNCTFCCADELRGGCFFGAFLFNFTPLSLGSPVRVSLSFLFGGGSGCCSSSFIAGCFAIGAVVVARVCLFWVIP